MEIVTGAASGLIVVAIAAIARWISKNRAAKLTAPQWSLEHVAGDEWTLSRESARRALAAHLFDEGNEGHGPRVRALEYLRHGDFEKADRLRYGGIEAGMELTLHWIQGDRRWAVEFVIRDSERKYVFTRDDVRPYAD